MFEWSKQVILLTGGTGTFGQAFTKTLLKKHPPKVLRIYSRDEYKQYLMQQQINHKNVRYFIGDVRDEDRLKRAIEGVTLVIHAAAMKQIVASEYNPTEAVKTNIIGTMNVLSASLDEGVERIFGLITDKAVIPINLYGATKLCMEKLLIQGNSYVGRGKTKISCVRYGNVAGSRGSVIPLFQEQLKKNKFTITHKDMTRFWLTLQGAVDLVIKSIESMNGGEVFVPKIPSFRISDLAQVMSPKAKIKYIGIRPGEKMHEDLITSHEARNVREFINHYVVYPQFDFSRTVRQNPPGKKVSENFSYNSMTNPHYLSLGDIRSYMKNLSDV